MREWQRTVNESYRAAWGKQFAAYFHHPAFWTAEVLLVPVITSVATLRADDIAQWVADAPQGSEGRQWIPVIVGLFVLVTIIAVAAIVAAFVVPWVQRNRARSALKETMEPRLAIDSTPIVYPDRQGMRYRGFRVRNLGLEPINDVHCVLKSYERIEGEPPAEFEEKSSYEGFEFVWSPLEFGGVGRNLGSFEEAIAYVGVTSALTEEAAKSFGTPTNLYLSSGPTGQFKRGPGRHRAVATIASRSTQSYVKPMTVQIDIVFRGSAELEIEAIDITKR